MTTTTTTDTYEEYTCSSGAIDTSAPHSGSGTGGGCGSGGGSGSSNQVLVQQVLELRRRLDDDHQGYKRKLAHYQDSQQKQAQLVSKLQQKILQYKSKCTELEHAIESKNIEIEHFRVILFYLFFSIVVDYL